MNKKSINIRIKAAALALLSATAPLPWAGAETGMLFSCSGDDDISQNLGPLKPAEDVFGKANDVFTADEWYPGGQLGTTRKASYSAPAPAVESVAGMEEDFNTGEDFFEHLYTFEQAPRRGLGPAWVRNSCIA